MNEQGAGRRRALRLVAALAAVGLPGLAIGQSISRVPRVGVLGEQSASEPRLEAFRQALRQLGYNEGQNIFVVYRYLNGKLERVPELVADLLRMNLDVLVVGGSVSAQAAKAQTAAQPAPVIPVVFTVVGDPVGSGLVASLARPSGNLTGLSNLLLELSGKQLELLKAASPRISRVGVFYNPTNSIAARTFAEAREAARALSVTLRAYEIRQTSGFDSAFAALKAWRADALLVLSDPVFGSELSRLAALAASHRIPAIYNRREFAEQGGLMSYGPSFSENYRRAAIYVDKILKGAKPADLPVEEPVKFELVINAGTAKALGISVPQSVLMRADEVIR